jgi:Family of unknown function (DUF5681)
MTSDDSAVGYKRPPVHSRFQKGQSGNPRGRPKRVADFMEDAVEILGGTVTGQAKGKSLTLPTVQAVFRTVCRRALKGDSQALRRVIELMLTLEPAARDKARDKEENDARLREAARKYDRLMGADPDRIEQARKRPDPERDERNRRLEAMVREERRRLMREARRSQR